MNNMAGPSVVIDTYLSDFNDNSTDLFNSFTNSDTFVDISCRFGKVSKRPSDTTANIFLIEGSSIKRNGKLFAANAEAIAWAALL